MNNPYQTRRERSNPRFLVIKVWLLLNLIPSAVLLVGMLGFHLYDGFSTGFEPGLTIVQVQRDLTESEKQSLDIENLMDTEIKADYQTETSWLSGLFVPFFSGGVYEVSWIFVLFNFTIYYLLYRILHDITSGKTFVERNVKRIYIIGLVYVSWAIVTLIRRFWLESLVVAWDDRYRLDMDPQTHYFHLGVIVLIIGYIYRTGVALQKDKELTI